MTISGPIDQFIYQITLSDSDEDLLAKLFSFLCENWGELGRSGIYCLWDKRELVYVGKSDSCVASRVRSHKDKVFDGVSVFWASWDRYLIGGLESNLICRFLPKYNKCHLARNGRRVCVFCGTPAQDYAYDLKNGASVCDKCHDRFQLFWFIKSHGFIMDDGSISSTFPAWIEHVSKELELLRSLNREEE